MRHVLRVKFALGFSTIRTRTRHARITGALPKESLELARTAAERSFVLLKNEMLGSRHLLPLER